MSPRPRACGSTSTRPTGARRACPRAIAGRVADLDRADSVTVDPHKWFFQAYDIGGLLVRDGAHLGQVFGGRAPEYYRGGETPAGAGRAGGAGRATGADDQRTRPTSSTSTS